MRIIIEIDKYGMPVQVQTEAESDAMLESDGGAPQGMLPGAQGSEQSDSDLSVAKSTGGPPDWLVHSIESAMLAAGPSADETGFENGGAAPA